MNAMQTVPDMAGQFARAIAASDMQLLHDIEQARAVMREERAVDNSADPCWRFGDAAVAAEVRHFRRCVESARAANASAEYFLAQLTRLGASVDQDVGLT